MLALINNELARIEQEKNVRILHAVESGSRAWGFASPDSDYDVRFIYLRPLEHYLKLERTSDVIEWQLDETLDINGWDLQKALRLLYKSNCVLFEWTNSPIVYRTTPYWQELKSEINSYFIAKTGLYHYLNSARGNYREYLKQDTVRLKKYFYVIRPILACKWILDRGCPPPMLFEELVQAELEEKVKPIVHRLLELKRATPEMGEGEKIVELNEYIDANLGILKTIIDSLPDSRAGNWERLNALFLKAFRYVENRSLA